MALVAVLTQILLLRSKKGGRFPAAELLMVSYGARQHIRQNALQHLHQEIAITKKKGSFSFGGFVGSTQCCPIKSRIDSTGCRARYL